MEKKYSRAYRIICRFFKELGLYKEFVEYQRGETHVGYTCNSIPTDTITPVRAFGRTNLTLWFEDAKGIIIKPSLYEIFKVWIEEFYPKHTDQPAFYYEFHEKEYILDMPRKKIKLKNIIRKK